MGRYDGAMSPTRPLLMIPGPIEISPAVQAAFSVPPPGHLSPAVIEAMGSALSRMRRVWRAGGDAQPFVVAGSGTTAMEMAVANTVERGDRVVVVQTGYFSDRMAEMLRRRGAEVTVAESTPGDAPSPDEVRDALRATGAKERVKALVATHVDTSTAVRVDPRPLARLAREHGALSIFDGVCATAAEPFEMEAWDADVYVTASQKAVGAPPGLALLVAGPRALAARERLREKPPMVLDWSEWTPILRAYEDRKPAYFATPATNLVLALDAALGEIEARGVEKTWADHVRAARAMDAAWDALGLERVPLRSDLRATTLSALRFPHGVDASLVARVIARGVVIAGGLHPAIRATYFRVGHMGYAATQNSMLVRTVNAIEGALRDSGIGIGEGVAQAAAEVALGG